MKRIYSIKTALKQSPAIYKISCTETEKIYIGETINVSQRIQKHFSLLRKNKHSNPILQNIFNKYGEKTFIVDILEYVDTKDELELKKLEKKYQEKFENCISLDSNEIFVVERTEEWKKQQAQQLNEIRELSLKNWRVPIIVYDVINKTHHEFKQLIDAEALIEQKHIYKNIKDKVLTPYKNQYVAFLKEEFTKENINKIISVRDGSYTYITKLCDLYDLLEDKVYHYTSKRQFSFFFSDHPNLKLYEKYLNDKILDFNFRCVYEIKTKRDLYNLNLNLRTRLSKTKCNFKLWYDTLKTEKSNIKIGEKTGINRTTIGDIFKDRSQIDWILLMEKVLSKLPD